jgi:hypothetical protein
MKAKHLKTISCLAVLLAGNLGILRAQAPALNPLSGYTGFQQQYSIPYSNTPGYGAASPSASTVAISILGTTHDIILDTGSRGLYVSANMLPSGYTPTGVAGDLYLSSSKRFFQGTWADLTISFPQANAVGGVTGAAQSTLPVLVAQSITAQGGPATFQTQIASGNVTLTNSALVPFSGGTLTLQPGQIAAYADNIGILGTASNFGVGIDPSGTSTTPNNTNQYNQQYNAFLNLDQMKAGTMRAGYTLGQSGVHVGLTESTTGFAYTNLIPTGLAQVPGSPPDWQIATGAVVYGGNTSATGRILVDIGIGNAYLTLPEGTSGNVTGNYNVNLLNSDGAVSFEVNDDSDNILQPSISSETGWRTEWTAYDQSSSNPFSESQPPYGTQFLNTGRNVINGFDLVYDGTGGLFGLKPNSSVPSAIMTFAAGYYPSPIPEPSAGILAAVSAVIMLGWRLSRRNAESLKTAATRATSWHAQAASIPARLPIP